MTATLAARLIASGKHNLHWATTLESVFPEIPIHEDFKKVTLQDLLAHRGGVTADLTTFEGGELWAKLWSPKLGPSDGRYLVTHGVLSKEPETTPGEQYVYSNAGYIIAGALLEKRTQQSWEELMRNELFRPLGMHSCGFGAAGSAAKTSPDEPWGHVIIEKSFRGVRPGRKADNPATLGPAGTVNCPLAAWARFAQAHLFAMDGEKTPLMGPQSFAPLHTDYLDQGYTPGGFGYRKDAETSEVTLWHAGSNTMNYAFLSLNVETQRGVLITTNMGDGDKAEALFRDVLRLLAPSTAGSTKK